MKNARLLGIVRGFVMEFPKPEVMLVTEVTPFFPFSELYRGVAWNMQKKRHLGHLRHFDHFESLSPRVMIPRPL